MLLILHLLRLVQLLVFVRVLLTWIMPSPPRAILPITNRIDLILRRFQVLIRAGHGYLDLGPMLFLLLLMAVERFLIALATGGFATIF